jgi:hypothetical protein
MNQEVSRREDLSNSLYRVLDNYVPVKVLAAKNRAKVWKYGYDETHDMVVISKSGQIGDIYEIEGLKIALPRYDRDQVISRSRQASAQHWEREDPPKELQRIKSIFQWREMPNSFKSKYIPYIENEFDRREYGVFFMNNGNPTYITGSHYMYLQWSKIDVGYPDFREANRILYIFWEACKADDRSFGMVYLKIRRSGFSFMASEECVNTGTINKKARVGILSKTGPDAKKMFTEKVVPINTNLPFFFKPIMDGMDRPKTELSYRIPASKITKKNMSSIGDDEEGLESSIDWRNTDDNSYDGEKLLLLVHDESGKWLKPNNILNNLRVTKTCLRLGRKIVGKCMMGSTSNALSKGGKEYKSVYEDSRASKRNKNGQTKSGLYAIFIPMEWNTEGYIDKYGMPVFRTPEKPVLGVDGEYISIGAIDWWENEVESLKNDPDALNEFYRQFPRTESHAFRDESKESIMNLTKIYEQIDYNDPITVSRLVSTGNFQWKDGIKDTEVIWVPDVRGRFRVSWTPEPAQRNNVVTRNGIKYPGNEHMGAFGCDPYDISGVVSGGFSNGSLHGLTGFHMDRGPVNHFFLEYIARPPLAEIFFEDVLMAIVFYGMPMLAENNKARLLYHIKNRGYRGFSMNRPDKHYNKLSVTEREIGGIPSNSEDIIQTHASAIQSYIEKYVGYDREGRYRDPDEMGDMPFNRTLEDWARFNISDRTKHDASISSGLAIMACQRNLYLPAQEKPSKITVKFARYNNTGSRSVLNRREQHG